MAELPDHHHFTRFWLWREAAASGRGMIVRLYDRLTHEKFGQEFRYPKEFSEAVGQLRMMRSRHSEVMDEYVFCDGLGSVDGDIDTM